MAGPAGRRRSRLLRCTPLIVLFCTVKCCPHAYCSLKNRISGSLAYVPGCILPAFLKIKSILLQYPGRCIPIRGKPGTVGLHVANEPA